jgi:hypothetical protein
MRKMMLITLFLLATLPASAATSTTPTVNGGTINYSSGRVTLTGSGFEPAKAAPTVKFNGASLKIDSFSDKQIVATLPAGTSVGTFTLKVKNSDGKEASFDLTYGATGPQGLQGPAGPEGPAGATGATGQRGPTGKNGSSGGAVSFTTTGSVGGAVVLPAGEYGNVYTITLPNVGAYLIAGQVEIENSNTNPIDVYCHMADNARGVSAIGLPSSIGGTHGGGAVTVPLNGYYVAQTAPITLYVSCAYGVQDPKDAIPEPVYVSTVSLAAPQMQ